MFCGFNKSFLKYFFFMDSLTFQMKQNTKLLSVLKAEKVFPNLVFFFCVLVFS